MKEKQSKRLYVRFPHAEERQIPNLFPREFSLESYFQALKNELCSKLEDSRWRNHLFAHISIGGGSAWLSEKGRISELLGFLLDNVPLAEHCYVTLRAESEYIHPKFLEELEEWTGVHLLLRAHESNVLNSEKLRAACKLLHENRKESYAVSVTTGCKVQPPLSLRNDLRFLLSIRPPVIKTRNPRTRNQPLALTRGLSKYFMRSENTPGRKRFKQAFSEAMICAGYKSMDDGIFSLSESNFPLQRKCSGVLGIGAGAVSLLPKLRGEDSQRARNMNSHSVSRYLADWKEVEPPKLDSSVQLDLIDQYHHFLIQTFCKGEPVDLNYIENQFGIPIAVIHPGLVEILSETGFIERSGRSIILTGKGLLQAEKVTRNFFIQEEDLVYLTSDLDSAHSISRSPQSPGKQA